MRGLSGGGGGWRLVEGGWRGGGGGAEGGWRGVGGGLEESWRRGGGSVLQQIDRHPKVHFPPKHTQAPAKEAPHAQERPPPREGLLHSAIEKGGRAGGGLPKPPKKKHQQVHKGRIGGACTAQIAHVGECVSVCDIWRNSWDSACVNSPRHNRRLNVPRARASTACVASMCNCGVKQCECSDAKP